MSSSPLPVARPWTPPDMDSDGELRLRWSTDGSTRHATTTADSGYFEGAFHDSPTKTQVDDNAWPSSASQSSHLPTTPSISYRSRGPPLHLHEAGGLGITNPDARPFTPIKSASYSNAHAPMYPYTPDSARSTLQRSQTFDISSSPLPAMPWDSSPSSIATDHTHTSPVQNALISCLRNLEHHIHAQQPNDDQIEHLILQFESMTSYLSAPESQTRGLDEYLFSEPEPGNSSGSSSEITKQEAEAYVTEVGKYIEGVTKHAQDLKSRFDEVKELNQINLDIIADLRSQPQAQGAKPVKDEAELQKEEWKEKGPRRKDQPYGFWSAMAEALDHMGDMLHGW